MLGLIDILCDLYLSVICHWNTSLVSVWVLLVLVIQLVGQSVTQTWSVIQTLSVSHTLSVSQT